MKINFKKIASVLATTVMLGSTVALAAAAYPEPFVKSGAPNAAIVVGSLGAADDMAAAVSLSNSLGTKITASTGSTVTGEGDKVKIDKPSVKLNLGDGLGTVWGTSMTKSDLPILLADETFRNKNNDEYKYTQTLTIGNLSFGLFSDSDYNDRAPTLGFKINSGTTVANYTIDFTTKPESAHGSDLADFENRNIKVLGKDYFILDFKNSTAKITLLDSATSLTLADGDAPKTVTVNGKAYTIAINFIGTSGSTNVAKLTVNGETTTSLDATTANTYKLTDGTYVGIKEINVQNYAGGTKSVEFSLGSGKLEMTSGSNVKMNDKTVNGLKSWITLDSTGTKTKFNKLVLEWKLEDKTFFTPGKELSMPGFGAVKFTMADTTVPATEKTLIEYSSDDVAQIKTTIKDGDVTIPILYFSTTTGNITGVGKSATEKLITSKSTALTFNATDSGNRFVVSWANARDAESYYMKASVTQGSDGELNKTTLSKLVDGSWVEVCTDLSTTVNKCSAGLGNIELTILGVAYKADGTKNVTMSVNSGGNFSTLYTKEGLLIYLPVDNSTSGSGPGGIDLGDTTYDHNSFTLVMSEEDRNGDLNKKTFNATISTSGTTTKRVSVTGRAGFSNDANGYETSSGSKLWEDYIYSDLATKVSWDKTNSDQYDATIEYHGSEVYGNVYVAAPSVVSGAASAIKIVKDTEVDSVKDKNLIVIGGSCVNTLAATLLGKSSPVCGEDFTALTTVGANKYLIQVFDGPVAGSGNIAMLVAGYEAPQTTQAVNKIIADGADTTVGKKVVGPLLV